MARALGKIKRNGPTGKPFCLYDSKGKKRIACHRTRAQAVRQERAIWASKRRRSR